MRATQAPDAHRGKIVGAVMIDLLLGILLSRVISGFGAEQFGWRSNAGNRFIIGCIGGAQARQKEHMSLLVHVIIIE